MKEKFPVSSIRSLALLVLIIFISLVPAPAFAAEPGQRNLLVMGVVGVLVFLGLVVAIGGVLLVIRVRRLKAAQAAAPDLSLPDAPDLSPPTETALTPAEAALARSHDETPVEAAQPEEVSTPEEAAPTVIRPIASPVTSDITIELADAPADIIQFIQDVISGVPRSSSIGTIYKGEQVIVKYDKGQFVLEYLTRPEKLLVAEGTPGVHRAEEGSGAAVSDISAAEESVVEEPAEAVAESPAVHGEVAEEIVSEWKAPAATSMPGETTGEPVQEKGEAQEAAIPTIMIHRDALLKEEEALAQKERSEIVCPACGVPNDASLEYCLECGAKIAGEAKAETETEKAAETEAETEEAAEVKEEPLPANIEETEAQPEAAEAEGPPAGKEQVCPVCGTKFALDTKVCPNCGVKIL